MMEEKNEIIQGWNFSSKIASSSIATQVGADYVGRVNDAIDAMVKDLGKLKSNQTDAVLGGYLAEHWHAGTFNINAAATESLHRAKTLGSTEYASVDIATNFGQSYSSKYMGTSEQTATAQAAYSRDLGAPKYQGQEQVVPSDQLDGAIAVAKQRAMKNADSRPEVASSYEYTSQHLTDRISDGEGVESKPLSKKESIALAKKVKEKGEDLSGEDVGVSFSNSVTNREIFKKIMDAGYSAAFVTVAMQLAPDIYKAIDYLIKNKKINLQQVKQMGLKAISSGTEGFLRGSISCALYMGCVQGKFGETFKQVNPSILGTIVSVVLETAKNSILVAAGKMSAKQMGDRFIDSVIVSSGFLVGQKIGVAIGTLLNLQVPVVGYLIGSLIGTAFSVVYQIGKKKLISFCVDSGFTCFGLVDQDYSLPESVLKGLGIDVIDIPRTEVPTTNLQRTEVRSQLSSTPLETINISMIKRGIISVNKVGYIQ